MHLKMALINQKILSKNTRELYEKTLKGQAIYYLKVSVQGEEQFKNWEDGNPEEP